MRGNGFMAVSATDAALWLAQAFGRTTGAGWPGWTRMMTARCAGFLQRSLPSFWPTPSPVPDRRRWLPRPQTAVTCGRAWTDEQDEVLSDAVGAGVGIGEVIEHLELAPTW